MLQKNDKVFYCDNGRGVSSYRGAASKTIQTLGLTPLVYGGAGLGARNSNIDKEIRDDFYKSKVVVLLIGEGGKWMSIEDNWALPELETAISKGIDCLVYITSGLTELGIRRLHLTSSVIAVNNEKHFESSLKQNLERLMIVSP